MIEIKLEDGKVAKLKNTGNYVRIEFEDGTYVESQSITDMLLYKIIQSLS